MLNYRAQSALFNWCDYLIYFSRLGRLLFTSLLFNVDFVRKDTLGQNLVLTVRADALSIALISLSRPAVSTSFGSMPIMWTFFA